jgi:hypothetical protein
VGLALALEHLRRTNTSVSVLDAYYAYTGIFLNKTVKARTNTLEASWKGEWARFDGANGSVVYTNQVRSLYIPVGATKLVLDMQYVAMSLDERSAGTLGLRVDTNGDGKPDYTGSTSPTVTGTRHEELDISNDGAYMGVDVAGNGFALKYHPSILPGSANIQYWEVLIPYAITVTLVFTAPANGTNATLEAMDYTPRVVPWQFGEPTADYKNGTTLSMFKPFYNPENVTLRKRTPKPPALQPGFQWWLILVVLAVVGLGLGWREMKKRGLDKKLFERGNFRLPGRKKRESPE